MVAKTNANVASQARKAGGGTGKTTRGKSKGTAGSGKYEGFKTVKGGRQGK